MKFVVLWEHKTGFPRVAIFEFEAKTDAAAKKVLDDVIPKTNRAGAEVRRFCKVEQKKGATRGKP